LLAVAVDKQDAQAEAPATAAMEPAGQGKQAEAPKRLVNEPAGQTEHDDAPVLPKNVPGRQEVQFTIEEDPLF